MISPERKHELAVEIGARRANDALERTPSGVVYRLIEGLDDIAPMPEHKKRELAIDVADLIRTGRAVFVRPQDYVGKGDGEPIQGSDNPEGWEDSWDRERAADYEKWREGEDSAGRGADEQHSDPHPADGAE